MDFALPVDQGVKLKERNYLGIEKTVEDESNVDSNSNRCSWYSQEPGGLGNKRTSGANPNYYIIEIV